MTGFMLEVFMMLKLHVVSFEVVALCCVTGGCQHFGRASLY